MGEYFKKISESLHKECGERPVAYKIEEHNFLAEHFLTDDSLILKGSAEKFIEKVEVIGLNILENQKFKQRTNERIEQLEKKIPTFFTIDEFRDSS